MTTTDPTLTDEDRGALIDVARAMAPLVKRHDRGLSATLERAADLTDERLITAIAGGVQIVLPILRAAIAASWRPVLDTYCRVIDHLAPAGLLDDACPPRLPQRQGRRPAPARRPQPGHRRSGRRRRDPGRDRRGARRRPALHPPNPPPGKRQLAVVGQRWPRPSRE